MNYVFKNRVSTTLASSLAINATTMTLVTGAGALLPALDVVNGLVCQLTLTASDGTVEIVTATEVVGDVVTIERAKEGTAQSAFASGSRVEIAMTAGIAGNFLQRSGGQMTGDLDMNGKKIKNPVFNDQLAVPQVRTSVLKPADGSTEKQLLLPDQGGDPTIGGSTVVTVAMLAKVIFIWDGYLNQLPAWFKVCDGTRDTPDLRDTFILGWFVDETDGTSKEMTTGGAWTGETDEAGDHNHSGKTGGTQLGRANIPTLSIDRQGGTDGGNQRVRDVSFNSTLGEAHTHDIEDAEAHTHPFTFIPPYAARLFVMFAIN